MDLDIPTNADPAIYSFLSVCSKSMSSHSEGVAAARSNGWQLDEDSPVNHTVSSVEKRADLTKDIGEGSYILTVFESELNEVFRRSCSLYRISFDGDEDSSAPNLLEISEALGEEGVIELTKNGFVGYWTNGSYPKEVFVVANIARDSGRPTHFHMSVKTK